MDTRELRIGNLVFHKEMIRTVIGTTHSCVFFDIIEGTDAISSIGQKLEPIPLTEEWLIKLGFSKCSFIDWQFNSPHENDYRVCDDGKFIFRGLGASIVEIKSVHQLQNLYFALTGEELTINN